MLPNIPKELVFIVLIVKIMEVRIYRSLEMRSAAKLLFCSRVDCLDIFSFEKCIDTFRAIYGSSVVIEFLVV